MAIFGRRTRVLREYGTSARALTAAATRIGEDAEDTKALEAYLRRSEAWVGRAWMNHDQIPEVRYAARYFGDGLSRLTLYPGIRPDPFSEPVPLAPEGDSKLGYTKADATLAIDTLARLRNPHGGQAEIMRRLGVQLFVPGEALLMGREDDTLGERWDVYSTDELQLKDGNYELLSAPSTSMLTQAGVSIGKVKGTYPKDSVVVVRIWRQHPRWSDQADSPMRSAELILDELLVLTKAIKAVALSRVAGAGMMFLPNSIRRKIGLQSDASTGGQAAADDDVVADVIDATAAAITDPGSAASQVPVFVWVPDSVYADIGSDKLIRWSRELDEVMERQRESLLRRWATAADLPAEVLTGMSTLNHWNAWQIPVEAFRSHFEPAAVLAVNGLTSTFYAPALREAGADALAERVVIWFDPSGLITPPDQSKDYLEGYRLFLTSGEATRRALGISEEEAPDDDEIAKRIEWGERPGSGAQSSSQRTTPGPADVPGEQAAIAMPEPLALTAAATETAEPLTLLAAEPTTEAIPGLAETLGNMDATLSRDIFGAAEAAFRRALERANARIKSLTNTGGNSKLKADVKDLAPADLAVAAALGPRVVDRLANEDGNGTGGAALLFAGAFAPLGAEWSRRTRRVAEETIRLATLHGELSESEAQVLLDQLTEDTSAGWQLLLAALSAVAVEKLYRPIPDEGPGETVDQLLPPALVRAALARAGGGGTHAVSMLTGGTVTSIYRQAKIEFKGWEWVYGDPSSRLNPFEPHMHLGGKPLTGPDDPKLIHASAFPPGGRYWPSDHRGCLCTIVRVAAVKVKTSTLIGNREVA